MGLATRAISTKKGEKVIAMTDNHGYVYLHSPSNRSMRRTLVLLPDGLKALKKVAKQVGWTFRDAYVNLDAGFDFNVRLIDRCYGEWR